jgi:hypothetical protein
VVEKLNIADALVDEKRSASFMKKMPRDTCPPILPDAVPSDGIISALVEITIPLLLPPVTAPMVSPERVTVTAVPAANALPVAANTMEVLPGAPGVSVTPAVDTLAVGVAEVA